MGFFKRLRTIVAAEANSAVEKLEDPIKITEQGIRDLRADLQTCMTSLAEVKALTVRAKQAWQEADGGAKDYSRKAEMVMKKVQQGQLAEREGETLALEALNIAETHGEKAPRLKAEYERIDTQASKLQARVEQLKQTITKYESELITLKARAKTAAATTKINSQLAKVDSSGTIAMLDRMKAKVEEEEALGDAYGDIAGVDEMSLDEKISGALSESNAEDRLAKMKVRMGIS